MYMRSHNVLCAPVGETQGGSGEGSGGSALFTSPTGGGAPQPGTPTSSGTTPGAAASAPTGASSTHTNPTANVAPSWRSTLPKELQDDATLSKFTSVDALAQSYLNAQKLIGVDKIPVPGKHTSDEQWRDIYTKLGVPENLAEYQVKFKEGASVDPDFSKQYVENAHKLGILPKQAQALADWFSDENMKVETEMKDHMDNRFKQEMGKLQGEWGNAYDLNIARANKVINELGGPELAAHYKQMGIGGDTQTLKFLAKIGETLYKEHKFVEGQGGTQHLNPQEIDREISKLMSEPAYFDKQHPKNKMIVQEVQDLFKLKMPIDKR